MAETSKMEGPEALYQQRSQLGRVRPVGLGHAAVAGYNWATTVQSSGSFVFWG